MKNILGKKCSEMIDLSKQNVFVINVLYVTWKYPGISRNIDLYVKLSISIEGTWRTKMVVYEAITWNATQ